MYRLMLLIQLDLLVEVKNLKIVVVAPLANFKMFLVKLCNSIKVNFHN